ncbi:MAG: hypothetical protein ACI4LD_00765 [Lentihominibacter sp.]
MTEKTKNDLFYVCSLIEFIARKTLNKRGVVVDALGLSGIKKQISDAEVNHCLSFEQVSDEVIEAYHIKNGVFDTITNCEYSIPSYTDIGKLYTILVAECSEEGKEAEELEKIFKSFISDEISNFETGLYYQNPDYLKWSYKEGYLLP